MTVPAKLIPRVALFGNPVAARPVLSPDGKRLAFLAPDENGVLNIFVRTLPLGSPSQVTHDRGRGVHQVQWDEDNRHLLFFQDVNGNENWHIFRADTETGFVRDLTPFEGATAVLIATNKGFPDELLVALNLRDRSLFDAYRLNLRSFDLRLDTENPGQVIRWTADHAFVVRAGLASMATGGRAILARDSIASDWRTIVEWSPDETFGTILDFSPDNSGLFVLSSAGANATRLVEITLATGIDRVIASDPTYDVAGCLFDPLSHAPQAVAFLRARQEWTIIDDAIREEFVYLQAKHPGELLVLSRDRADRRWIVEFLSDNAAADFFLFDRTSRELSHLFSDYPQLREYSLSTVESVTIPARDGMMLHAFVTVPNWLERTNLPTVLLVHGGPWARDGQRYSPEVQRLANRGYAVLQVNFRGSSGYGKEYMNAGDRQWGLKIQDDLIDAKDWIIAQGIGDPKRIAIYGFSFGGYAAVAALTFQPGHFACGISAVAPYNLITFLESIPPHWTIQRAMFRKRVGDAINDREQLMAVSPFFHAEKIREPVLICHGANDPRAKRVESDQLVEKLHAHGKSVEYLLFDDEGHGIYKPHNRLRFFAAVERFLADHLGGRFEPESPSVDLPQTRPD
jgi:dipeptidyl aminopeptidase/acylaminoacyl peptidase